MKELWCLLFHRYIPFIDAESGFYFLFCRNEKKWIGKNKIRNKMAEADEF